ncbi:KEOPS complex subunit Cgi121 [Methanocella sp. MCL-LM]|uniref:KEOPS complex subunit Cgi121 n=1 Tax=Methanocella sp. MCL-LM TaxID=3412035 RepID=UPI003C76EEB3
MTPLIITGGKKHIADVKAFLKDAAAIGADYGTTVQAVNADAIAGRMHLEFATAKAIEAFRQKRNLARDLGMEIMLYLRGRRQIERALDMGVKQGDNNVAILIIGDNSEKALPAAKELLDSVDEKVIDYSRGKDELLMRLFEITPAEIEIVGRDRIPELVRERSALLEFEK